MHGAGFFGAYTDAVLPGQYTVEAGQSATGSALKWFKDNFAPDAVAEADRSGRNPYDLLSEAARDIPPGCDGLIFNEYLQGNRTPYTDSRARGMAWGLTLAHGRAHLFRALQEGICFGTAHNLQALRASGVQVDELVACGGMTKSAELMQLHADITGMPIALTEVGDAVALGAAMVAAVGAGIQPSLPDAADAMVHRAAVITPDPDRHARYRPFVQAYMDAYPRMSPLIHHVVDVSTASSGGTDVRSD